MDGAPVEIVPANLLVRGVAVPAGRHRLDMRYATVGMRAGVTATRAGLGAWGLLALFGVGVVIERGRRRGRSTFGSASPTA